MAIPPSCTPSGDVGILHAGWDVRAHYKRSTGGLKDNVWGFAMFYENLACLGGPDNYRWSDDDRNVYIWLCVQHIFDLLFDDWDQSDLPGPVTGDGDAGVVSWGAA